VKQALEKGIFFEAVHRRKDGSSFHVEVSSQGIKKGNILLSIIRDISERKKAENEMKASQLKYQSLFMNMLSAYAYFKVIYKYNVRYGCFSIANKKTPYGRTALHGNRKSTYGSC